MPHSRFFLNAPLSLNSTVQLQETEAHHIRNVMRMHPGEILELVNGLNQLAKASIVEITKKDVTLKITHIENLSAPPFQLIVCQALPRLNRLDIIVEKGTELGMTELRLFPGRLSEKKEINVSVLKRLTTITINAMKQCGRLDLPKITVYQPLLKWTEKEMVYPAFFGDLSKNAPPLLSIYTRPSDAMIFIGPEAGFHSEELKHLTLLKAQGVKLHPHILRTDTASLTALSLIQSLSS